MANRRRDLRTVMTIRANAFAACSLAIAALLASNGCRARPKLCPLSGHVTFKGQAVTEGLIRFSNPQAGVDVTASLRSDGAYEAAMSQGAGLPPGVYRVAVTPPLAQMPSDPAKTVPKLREFPNIPTKYRDVSTSGLTLTLEPGGSRFDVDMQPDK
jgi:hypothetical protein